MLSSAGAICIFLAGVALVRCGNVHEFVIDGGPGKFWWQNCEKDVKYPVNITGLSLTPDPIHPGSTVFLSFEADVNQDIGTTDTLQIDVEAKLKTSGIEVDVCDYTECHYKDVCALIKKYKAKCPPFIRKLVPDCQCPLKKKQYKIPKIPFSIPSVGVKVNGVLKMKVNVTEKNTKIGCLEMKIYIA